MSKGINFVIIVTISLLMPAKGLPPGKIFNTKIVPLNNLPVPDRTLLELTLTLHEFLNVLSTLTGGNNQLPLPLGDLSNISPPVPTELLPVEAPFTNPFENSLNAGRSLLANFRTRRAISDYFPSDTQPFFLNGLTNINCTVNSLAILKPVTDLLQHQLTACDLGRNTVMQLLRGTVNQIETLLQSVMNVNELFCGAEFGSPGLSEELKPSLARMDVNFGSGIGSGLGEGFIPTESVLDLGSTGLGGLQQGPALCLHQLRVQLRQLNDNLKLVTKLLNELLGEKLGACIGAIFKDLPRLTWLALSDNIGKCYQ